MSKNQDVMDRARKLDPVPPDAFRGLAESPNGQEMLNAILGTPSEVLSPNTRPRRARKVDWPRLQVGFAAGAAVLIAATIVITTIVPDRGGNGTPRPRDPLASASLVAAQDDRVVVGDGEYMYLHLTGQGTGTMDVAGRSMTALIPTATEIWVANDHTGRVVTTTGDPEFLSEADRSAWEAADRPVFSEVGVDDETFQAGDLFPVEDLDAYPTDPEELYNTLLEQARAAGRSPGRPPSTYVFTLASDLLFRFPEAPPALRSALFEVLGRVPGTQVESEVRDPAGRQSAVVSLVVPDEGDKLRRHDLYFDPDTAQVVAFQETVLTEADDPSVAAGEGSLRSNAVLVESGVVDSKRSRP